MDRTQLLADIVSAQVQPDDVLYLERRGDDYGWQVAGPGAQPLGPGEPAPDAWLFYSGPWPQDRPDDLPVFAEELLAEMESMCGGADRCRWPLDQPYPLQH